MMLALIGFLRPEIKFSSLIDLRFQIAEDVRLSRQLLLPDRQDISKQLSTRKDAALALLERHCQSLRSHQHESEWILHAVPGD